MSESECLWMQEIAAEVLKTHRVHLKCVKVIIQRVELKGWYSKFIRAGKTGASDKRRRLKAMIAMMRKLSKSLWHARVNDKEFDYALVITNPSPTAGRNRRRRKASRT